MRAGRFGSGCWRDWYAQVPLRLLTFTWPHRVPHLARLWYCGRNPVAGGVAGRSPLPWPGAPRRRGAVWLGWRRPGAAGCRRFRRWRAW